ncbi:oligopeptide/dipeptide ABC transporter ATPase subunit [Brachyspira sp. CAG:484]|nr:oligopeptide/dipeptide ABC transporter ATPase subunit [Brachyspira sp. CAG:484]
MENLIEIKDLYVEYKSNKGILGGTQIVHAVNGVSLDIKKGEILAVAGESGCGKSTLAKALIRLEPAKSGQINFECRNVLNMDKNELKSYRKKAQMVFQNPYSSLDPKMKIIDTLKEPLQINTDLSDEDIEAIIKEKIKKVGLNEESLELYPHEFSGGQRQRIAIARALVLNPEFILADEPVSALDVSIQAQIINLLKELKDDFNLTFVLITHDMSVIKYLADRVAVMYLGEIVEIGTTKEIFDNPCHPYTRALLSAVPQISGKESSREILKGDLPSPSNIPKGCKFHTRCPKCFEPCPISPPENSKLSETHFVKCYLYD